MQPASDIQASETGAPVASPVRSERARRMLTIQKALTDLSALPSGLRVKFDTGGHPRDLTAFDILSGDLVFNASPAPVNVSSVMAQLTGAMGQQFVDSRGTWFIAGPDTPLWVGRSLYSMPSALISLHRVGFDVVIATAPFDRRMAA